MLGNDGVSWRQGKWRWLKRMSWDEDVWKSGDETWGVNKGTING